MITWKFTSKEILNKMIENFSKISTYILDKGFLVEKPYVNLRYNENQPQLKIDNDNPFGAIFNQIDNSISNYENQIHSIINKHYRIEHQISNIDAVISFTFKIGTKYILFSTVRVGLKWFGFGEYEIDIDYPPADSADLYIEVLKILENIQKSNMFDFKYIDTSNFMKSHNISNVLKLANKMKIENDKIKEIIERINV